MKRLRTAALGALVLAAPTVGSIQACTDLTEVPSSALTPETFFRNEDEVLGALASVYAQLRDLTWGYYNLSEVSSDEIIVPTRGGDWYDNGRWLEIHRQTWTANSTSATDDMNGSWTGLFTGVTRANAVLGAIQNLNFPSKPVVEAELRTLRAYYYYLLQDLFGGVPIVTDIEIKRRERNTRAEVFAFIEQELNESRGVLPDRWGSGNYGRVTKGAADAILASLYLNAQVFSGTVTAGGLQPGQQRWQQAIDAADRVINSGAYSLASNWRSNFTADNYSSPEIIMAITYLNSPGLGLNFIMRALHYHQFDPSPWNGFATIAETYHAFDADDQRRQVFLVGRASNVETGDPVNDRSGAPLFFTPDIADPTAATEGEGVRIYKWPADPNHVQENNGNDFGVFRLAEMYLIRAEAMNELGQTAQAINLVNSVIRARAFSPQKPLSTSLSQAQFREAILNERLFELISESKRRQDLIRHGKYTRPWSFKMANVQCYPSACPGSGREPFRILMPIPQTQLDANPLLTQNPGY